MVNDPNSKEFKRALDEHITREPDWGEEEVELQQPVKGELVDACKGCSVEFIQPGCSEEDKNKCDRWDLARAQRAHDVQRLDVARAFERGKITLKAQGWVKLPNEDELTDKLTPLLLLYMTIGRVRLFIEELCCLLSKSEKGEEKP